MEVVVITSSGTQEGEIQEIIELFEHGLDTLHLRKPKYSREEFQDFIEQVPARFHSKIIIHGHYGLALKYNLKGVHLHRRHRGDKWRNRWKRFVLRFRKPSLAITTTFSSVQSLQENTLSFDYVFLSPIFTSDSKYNYKDGLGVNLLKKVIQQSGQKVYALGGVDETKLDIIESVGFEGVGLSRSLWKSKKPALSILDAFLNRYQAHKHAMA